MKYSVLITTINQLDIAEKIVSVLLKEKIVACVQIDEVKSYFVWSGKLQKEKEYRLMIKTKKDLYNLVEKKILEYHNYDVPEIIELEISNGLKQYMEWMNQSLKIL